MQKIHFWISTLIILLIILTPVSNGLADNGEIHEVLVTSSTDSGAGTLREAMLNAQAGDIIQFSPNVFPKRKPVAITLLSELPVMDCGNVTIDGNGSGVILDGSRLGGESVGLRILSDGNHIKGLQILNFPGDGITIADGASHNVIGGSEKGEGNTISGNGKNGIFIIGQGTDQNRIIGNRIGLDIDEDSSLPNQLHGVNIVNGAKGTLIGGDISSDRNVISGNINAGIYIENVVDTKIQGNIIGLTSDLRSTMGNNTCGIVIARSQGTLVGGEDDQYGNIFGGNSVGIDIWQGASENTITGNQIGYREFSGNLYVGLRFFDGAHDNTIGPNNVIAYNEQGGIEFDGVDSLRNNITANSIHSNNDVALVFKDIPDKDMSPVIIQYLSSRSIMGSTDPGAKVEVYSDLGEEARYFEASTRADENGNFNLLLPSGTFHGKNVRVLAINTDGQINALSAGAQNPGFGVVKELPNIPAPEQVSTDPIVVGTNFVVAVISVVFFGFTTSVFNNIIKNIELPVRKNWQKYIPGKMRTFYAKIKQADMSSKGEDRWRFLGMWFAIVLINALVESFLDPNIGFFDTARLRSIAGLLVAGLVISGLEWGSDLWVHRRLCDRSHARSELRWFGLLAALASMLVSRAVHFTPGYILGTMGNIMLLPELCERKQAGKRAGVVLASIFTCGVLLWFGSSLLPDSLGWLEALFLNIFTISLQGVLFELIPLDVFNGSDLWKWKKWIWFLFFLVVFWGFTHIFLNPNGQDVQALQQNGIQTLLIVMGLYGLATLGLWIAYRKKDRKRNESSVEVA